MLSRAACHQMEFQNETRFHRRTLLCVNLMYGFLETRFTSVHRALVVSLRRAVNHRV